MALWFIEGFEAYGDTNGVAPNSIAINGPWDQGSFSGSVTRTIEDGRISGKSIKIAGGSATDSGLPSNVNGTINGSTGDDEAVLGFAFKATTLFSNAIVGLQQNNRLIHFGISLHLVNTGALAVGIGDGSSSFTIDGTSGTTPIQADTWHYIEFKVLASDTGAYEVKVDGTTVLSGIADTLISGGNNRSICFYGAGTGNEYFIDDLYVLDTTGSVNNDFLGDQYVLTLHPTGNGSTNTGTPTPAVDNWENISETLQDGDTSYVTVGSGTLDLFVFDDVTQFSDIAGVRISSIGRRSSGTTPQNIANRVRSGGNNYVIGTGAALGTTYFNVTNVAEVDPNTTTLWDDTSVNAAEFGFARFNAGSCRVTQNYIAVLGTYIQPPQAYDVSAESVITMTSVARNQWAVVEGESTVALTHEATGELDFIEGPVESVIAVTDEASAVLFPLMDSADTIAISETASSSVVYTVTAEDTIDLTETADRSGPFYLFAVDTIALTESATYDDGVSRAGDTLSLVEVASASMQADLSASDSIAIQEAASYILITSKTTEEYSPFVGGSSDPNAPDPPSTTVPTLTPGSVTLEYPFDTPTETLTLRRPLFGNRDRLSHQRINRTTRGNKLVIFADLQWPKVHTLVMEFSPVEEDDAQDYLDFVSASLGKEIKLTDWEGRVWRGLIVNPDDPMTRDHRCNNTISLTFEGEQV